MELAGLTEGVRSDSKTVNQLIEKKGERILPCAMPESTQGEETEPPRRTWDRVPQRKLARRCQRRPVTPKSRRRTRVASTQQESKAFLMCARDGGGARNPQRWRPWRRHTNGNRPGKGRVVENVGQCERKASARKL